MLWLRLKSSQNSTKPTSALRPSRPLAGGSAPARNLTLVQSVAYVCFRPIADISPRPQTVGLDQHFRRADGQQLRNLRGRGSYSSCEVLTALRFIAEPGNGRTERTPVPSSNRHANEASMRGEILQGKGA